MARMPLATVDATLDTVEVSLVTAREKENGKGAGERERKKGREGRGERERGPGRADIKWAGVMKVYGFHGTRVY